MFALSSFPFYTPILHLSHHHHPNLLLPHLLARCFIMVLAFSCVLSSSHTTTLLFSLPSSPSISNPFFCHSRHFNLVAMNAQNPSIFDSSLEHDWGDWYSAPEISLRDHLFIVPLNYSKGIHSSPKISVFAREVAAGNGSH
ncbi:hypothetical protein RIF29_04338 [Crotalaria pallida]|uniref:Uncharacterized protein n=1 Tax=Crotalaria pallida TaxID=3830 RepID=A0AAN9P962_CROPI